MQHESHAVNGASLHLARAGAGRPLLLLHGWPEFSLTWEPVMERLAGQWELLAPDLRGFGASDKPSGPFGAPNHARDMLALLDTLGIEKVGIVAHDVGGTVAQAMAREKPDRFTGLFFFNFNYPGIGTRAGTPDRLDEIWYQSFHQSALAPALVGSSREAVREYITHFLMHWSHRKDAFDDVLERFVDNFCAPGNLEGGFSYYRASAAGRLLSMKGEAPALPPIELPTCVRWSEHDPVFPFAWTDRLREYFLKLDFDMFPDVGHFPHRENPDRAAEEIARFFEKL